MSATKTHTTYRAYLNNEIGAQLDMISSDEIETLARLIGKRLICGEWLLREGDTIRVVETVR